MLRLSGSKTLQDLLTEADELWPPHPKSIAELEAWLERGRALVAELPLHRRTLAEMREGALPRSPEEAERDRTGHPRFGELALLERELANIRRAHAIRRGEADAGPADVDERELAATTFDVNKHAWELVRPARPTRGHEARGLALARHAFSRSDSADTETRDTLAWALFANGFHEDALATSQEALALAPEAAKPQYAGYLQRLQDSVAGTQVVERKISALEAELALRRTWSFSTPEDQWQHDALQALLAGVEDLEAGLLAQDAIVAQHGWSVPKRLAFARDLERGFGSGGAYERAWTDAAPGIAAAYPGLDLGPQVGLVPIGADPQSGLWEFAHLMTGTPAKRGADGKLALNEETGVVLVLLAGGSFWMGAQPWDPDGRNHDPRARGDESPVHEVKLSPFFLSKYELTRSQWRRFELHDRSRAGGGLLGPVVRVDWFSSDQACERLGLSLPTESQWEYGARGGTASVWWTGDDESTLRGAANLSDRSLRDRGGAAADYRTALVRARHLDWLDDGAALAAAVGKYLPNPFGLHDVHGNVEEWCHAAPSYTPGSRVDALTRSSSWLRIHRGGSFVTGTFLARAACRGRNTPQYSEQDIGFRPARSVDPKL